MLIRTCYSSSGTKFQVTLLWFHAFSLNFSIVFGGCICYYIVHQSTCKEKTTFQKEIKLNQFLLYKKYVEPYKLNFKLMCHIAGPKGCGKSTLGKSLQTKFGGKIMVKDLDDFDKDGAIDWKNTPSIDEMLYNRYIKKQKSLDSFLKTVGKPTVLVGVHNEGCFILNIPTCNRFLMNVTADQAAHNAINRHKRAQDVNLAAKRPDLLDNHKVDVNIEDLDTRRIEAQKDIDFLSKTGYVRKNNAEIEQWIQENLPTK